jgi:hypothetical protein
MSLFIPVIPNPPPQDFDENEELVAIDEAIEANAQDMDWMPEEVVDEWLVVDDNFEQDIEHDFVVLFGDEGDDNFQNEDIEHDFVVLFGDEGDDNFQNGDIFQINLQPEEIVDFHLFADNNENDDDSLPDLIEDDDIFFQEPISHPA